MGYLIASAEQNERAIINICICRIVLECQLQHTSHSVLHIISDKIGQAENIIT